MPGTTGPNLGLVWGYAAHDNLWGVNGYNPGFARLDTLVQGAVLTIQNTPPVSPANGDRYIVGTVPTGAWIGHGDAVAVWLTIGTPAWLFLAPKAGWSMFNANTGLFMFYNGSAWISTPGEFVLAGSWTFSTNVTQVDFTGLAQFNEIQVLVKGLTLGTSGAAAVRVSTDNGSTFLAASGDYEAVTPATGVEVADTSLPMYGTSATAARSAMLSISGWRMSTAPKLVRSSRVDFPTYYIPTLTALNALRVLPTGGGNMTGGSIYVLGR